MRLRSLPQAALVLGVAGLLPQILAYAATFDEGDRYVGLAAGFFYAALILSFIGGLWWGVAAARWDAPGWLYAASVMPSLIAFASGIPWMTGAAWPQPSLGWLGLCLLGSTVVDVRLARLGMIAAEMLRLRAVLSLGLGLLTLALAYR